VAGRAASSVRARAPGTTEEGILSILGFKQSLFAGVLDGGAPTVSLGGSRLGRLIETVERVTGAAPVTKPAEPTAASTAAATAGPDGDPWAGERYLKVRLPAPEVIGAALRAVRALLQGPPG
jgi:hypothetical protein